MYTAKNVVICAIRSERIIKASALAAMLFPQAVFHIVSVIKRPRTRALYTSLINDVMERIADEAIHEIELELLKRGVNIIRKIVLYGEPAKEVLRYIDSVSADLVVLSSSASEALPPHLVGKTAEKILTHIHVPALVYTPLAKEPPQRLDSILLVLSSSTYVTQALSLALSLAHRAGISVSILLLSETSTLDLELSRIYSAAFDVKIDIEPLYVEEKEMLKEIVRFAEKVDLLVIDKKLIHRPSPWSRILGSRKLGALERAILSLSPVPVMIV